MNINYKETLIEAAHAGGEILKKYFGQTLNLIEKSTASDFKTEADAIVKSIKDEVFLNLGLKPKEDYLTKTVLSHEVMRSLTARYSNPSNYLLN